MRAYHVGIVLFLQVFAGATAVDAATDRQEVVNTIRQAAHAYWAQRIEIEHPRDGVLYGYAGAQTIVDPGNPQDRYYSSDGGWIPEPHIFQEVEDSPGHPGVGFAFLRAYLATGDKFLMRAAKELGDTLISAQKDLGVGGWWQDMGVIAYDRREGSPTYRETVDFGKWMNLEAWGGHGNVEIVTVDGKEYNTQEIGSFDGCSFLSGYFLLRLYQALPEDDPDRNKYLEAAKWLADEIVGFKDVVDAEGGFKPYGNGGVPQMWPYNVMKDRLGAESHSSYPYTVPHNVMVTLNDDAMTGALFFLVDFWKEVRTNTALFEPTYRDAIQLHMDYLMDVFDAAANANGRSAWASFYWINDGSERANKPTWGRAYEPPGLGFYAERADDALLLWYQYETDAARKTRIENTLKNFLLYFKYDAPPVNSRAEWRDMIRPYIRSSAYIDSYDPDNITTWYWWLWYNHDESVAPREVFVASEDVYHAYYGNDALVQENNPDDHYPMIRNTIAFKMLNSLQGEDELYLFDEANPNHNSRLDYYYGLAPEIRMFRGWEDTAWRADEAVSLFNEATGFFGSLNSMVRDDKTYYYVEDFTFETRMRHLAWGAENLTGVLVDSDGDGHTDADEMLAGTDIHDSEYYPGNPIPSDQIPPAVPENLTAEAISASQIDLQWDASGDNVRTAGYQIYRNGQFVTTVFSPGYSDTGLTANTEYTYTVSAYDIAGNNSGPSDPANATTTDSGNHTPVLTTIGDKSVNEGQTLLFTVTATDADSADSLRYSASSLPAGANFDEATQIFTWTPTHEQSGEYEVIVHVSDGQVYVSETVSITVNEVDNRPPELAAIGNRNVAENAELTFTINATDPDDDPLAYTAEPLPTGASFLGQTFAWTPTYEQAGSYSVTFTASDGTLSDSEEITIMVADVADETPPVVENCVPSADAIEVPVNTLIALTVSDTGWHVDASTVVIHVNGELVYSGGETMHDSAYGVCYRTGAASSYRYTYQPDEAFDYDQRVFVQVDASDLGGNAMDDPVSYEFATEMRSFGRNVRVSWGLADIDKARPATVCDSEGNIWAVWQAGGAGMRDIYVSRKTAGASEFAGPVRLTADAGDQSHPDIAVGTDDKLYVAWQDSRRGNWDIYVSTSADGATWSAETRVTDSNDNQVNPAIVVDSEVPNRAYIAWQDDSAGHQDIYVASSTTDFVNDTVSQVTSDIGEQVAPEIAVDAANTVYLVWIDGRNDSNDIYGAASNDGPWANVPVVTGPGNESSPVIATEASGSALHFAWVDDTGASRDVYYASSDGMPVAPLTGTDIVNDAADQVTPAIAATGSAGAGLRVFACWQDARNVSTSGDTDVYFVDVGAGSAESVFVGDDESLSNQSEPALGVGIYGYPYIVWTDDRDGNTEIYYAGSTFMDPYVVDSQEVTASTEQTVGVVPAAGLDDVSVVIPAGACLHDVTVTVTAIQNPPLFSSRHALGYDFGPSGLRFSEPVTITIPYLVADFGDEPPVPFWSDYYDSLSQEDITDIEILEITPGVVHAVQFKTTHFTPYYLVEGLPDGGDIVGGGGGGGGGGCALSAAEPVHPVEFFLPYFGLGLVVAALGWHDRKGRQSAGSGPRA